MSRGGVLKSDPGDNGRATWRTQSRPCQGHGNKATRRGTCGARPSGPGEHGIGAAGHETHGRWPRGTRGAVWAKGMDEEATRRGTHGRRPCGTRVAVQAKDMDKVGTVR